MTVTASVVPLTPSSVVHKQMMMKVDRHSHDDEQLMFNMEDNVTTATTVTTTATTPINITATPTIQTSLAVSLLVHFTHTTSTKGMHYTYSLSYSKLRSHH